MAAKVYDKGYWSMTDETGMYAQSFDFDFSVEKNYIRGTGGVHSGAAFFNESATFSLNGFLSSDSTMKPKLGAAQTLANAVNPEDYIDGYSSGGLALVTNTKRASKIDDFRALDVSGDFKPWMGALVV